MKNTPDYKKIYSDMISIKYPEKKEVCRIFLSKENLSVLDVITINNILFNTNCRESTQFNQKHRSYDVSAISYILQYQKRNELNNSQVAKHFKVSRNTITKWKNQILI
ncbi:transposase [Chryseobacterium phosphatilyticum]|uniref:Transposase n=1 Tax=Chryseobacterium phosphatilyticum TaxID=475075 RepID=A0A316X7Z2_9FLAO|nr:transposase [Chryseobacterium phosphatilyticum]PWN68846.1 transposase [Chryseobacterium phosphatilyticum]